MKTTLSLGLSSYLASVVYASGDAQYNYAYNGADWPANYPDCAGLNQSPIDLKSSTSTGFPIYKAAKDRLNRIYTNQEVDIPVNWNGETIKVAIDKEGQSQQTFSSLFSVENLGGGERFTGVQFHFHSGSEHTIDGQRFDLEMHTVHLAQDPVNDINYAAVGILFDAVNYNTKVTDVQGNIIKRFFESLRWSDPIEDENGIPTPSQVIVPKVPYGDLMMMVDMAKKFVYKGSVTTPPCATYVYWNVLRNIYPIPQEFVDQFKNQLRRGDKEGIELSATGNWRVIQDYDYHNAKTMVTPEVINLYVDELIREYFIYNGYTKALESIISESAAMNEEPTFTREQIVVRTDVNTTTQNIPIMYDLINRELKPDDYAAAEEERRLMWVEKDAAALAAKYDVNMSESDIDAALLAGYIELMEDQGLEFKQEEYETWITEGGQELRDLMVQAQEMKMQALKLQDDIDALMEAGDIEGMLALTQGLTADGGLLDEMAATAEDLQPDLDVVVDAAVDGASDAVADVSADVDVAVADAAALIPGDE